MDLFSLGLVSKLNLFFRFKVESAHCGGCHTMVRARPIPGYVYESSEEGTNTPIANGDEVMLWASECDQFFRTNSRKKNISRMFKIRLFLSKHLTIAIKWLF